MARTTTSILNFDEVHRLSIPYRDYFGAMYITPEQMHSRIELAEAIEDVFLYLFLFWDVVDEIELKQDAIDKLTSVVEKTTVIDPYLENHINNLVSEVVDVTKKREDERQEQEQKQTDNEDIQDYWLSRDRAMLISENEANAIYNYDEYREAKKSGKTQKTWITELDDKVRMTHTLVEGKTVDIDGLFFVGGSQMRFPKDTMYEPDASEVVNCRCSVEYK